MIKGAGFMFNVSGFYVLSCPVDSKLNFKLFGFFNFEIQASTGGHSSILNI